jgi:hypothetical protein
MIDILGKLLESPARVKLLRLFLFNPKSSYTLSEAVDRARVTPAEARREIALYQKVGLLRVRAGGSKRYVLDENFSYLAAFQHLLLNLPMRGKDIVRRLRTVGVVRLVILSGLFVDEYDGRVDVLVVGDKLSEAKLRVVIRALEAEIGKELKYVTLNTEEFRYRLGIYDKLVRDVLDYPHAVAYDRLHLPLK